MGRLPAGSVGWCRAAEATCVIGPRGPGGPIEVVGDALLAATPEPEAMPAYLWALGRLAFYLGHAGEKGSVERLYATLDSIVAKRTSMDLALETHVAALTASRMLNLSEWEKCLRAAALAVGATHLAQAQSTLADVLLHTGRAAEARDLAATAYATFLRLGRVGEDEWNIRAVYAEALHATGAIDEARAVLTEAKRDLDERVASI